MTDAAIGDHRVDGCSSEDSRVGAKGCGTRNRRAVDRTCPRDVQSHEHPVEQRRSPAGTGDVERVDKLILENVVGVEIDAAPKPGPFGSDIGNIQDPVLGDFAINSEVEILDIGRAAVRCVHGKRIVSPAVNRNGSQHRKLLRYGYGKVGKRQVSGCVIRELAVAETAECSR